MPSLGPFGSGKAAYTLSVSGVCANGDGGPDEPMLGTSTQEGRGSDDRSPWAVGASSLTERLSLRFRDNRFTLGTSWSVGSGDPSLLGFVFGS
jgi:hypothetical protein